MIIGGLSGAEWHILHMKASFSASLRPIGICWSFATEQILSTLRVQAHAHARIFAWLLGTCISETTADIAGNQTSMPEDQRELYTMQTTSAKVSRRQRHRGG